MKPGKIKARCLFGKFLHSDRADTGETRQGLCVSLGSAVFPALAEVVPRGHQPRSVRCFRPGLEAFLISVRALLLSDRFCSVALNGFSNL